MIMLKILTRLSLASKYLKKCRRPCYLISGETFGWETKIEFKCVAKVSKLAVQI